MTGAGSKLRSASTETLLLLPLRVTKLEPLISFRGQEAPIVIYSMKSSNQLVDSMFAADG
jgi:hypothetical protein